MESTRRVGTDLSRAEKRGAAYTYAALAEVPWDDYLDSSIGGWATLAPDGQGRAAVMEDFEMEARRNWKQVPGRATPSPRTGTRRSLWMPGESIPMTPRPRPASSTLSKVRLPRCVMHNSCCTHRASHFHVASCAT